MTKEEFILYVYFFSVNHLLRHDFRLSPPFEFAICLKTLSESGFSCLNQDSLDLRIFRSTAAHSLVA